MTVRTIVVHDRCKTEDCKRILLTIAEGERGICSSCWFNSLKPEIKDSLNRVIKSAFDGSNAEEKSVAVEEAMAKLRSERP